MERPVIAGEFAPLRPDSDQSPSLEPVTPPAAERSVIVELLGGQGQVRDRTRLTTLPAVIGRGYDADVLIDDPHIDARHAELSRDAAGILVLRDLGSVNGIGRSRAERVTEIALASGDRVRLGPVEIRIVDASHPVPDAVRIAPARGLTPGIANPGRALAVCAAAFVVIALLNYQSSAESEALVPALQEAVYIVAGVGLWASAWAFATRLVSRSFRILAHWAWSLAVVVAGIVLTVIGGWLDFLSPSMEAGSWLAAVGGLALLPVLIAGHLEIASSMTARSRWRAALSVGAIVVAFTAIASLGEDGAENTWSLDFSGTLKPLPERLIPTVSLDEFMQATEKLQGEIDAELADDADEADGPEAEPGPVRGDTAGP